MSEQTAAHSVMWSILWFLSQLKTPASPSTSSMCRPTSTICCLSFSRYITILKMFVALPVCVCSVVFSSSVIVLCQNAMRATVETHETSPTLPPIKVRVSLGSEDLTIKVTEGWSEPADRTMRGPWWFLTYFSFIFRCLTEEAESLWGRSSVCSATCTPRLPVQSTQTTLATHLWWDSPCFRTTL